MRVVLAYRKEVEGENSRGAGPGLFPGPGKEDAMELVKTVKSAG